MFTNYLNFFSESVFDLIYPNDIQNDIKYSYVRPAFESLPIVRNNHLFNRQGFMIAYGSQLDTCITIYPHSDADKSPWDGFAGMSLYTNMNGDVVTFTKNPNLGNCLHAFKNDIDPDTLPNTTAKEKLLKYYGVFDHVGGTKNNKVISWGDEVNFNNTSNLWNNISTNYPTNPDNKVRMRCTSTGNPYSHVDYAMKCYTSNLDDPKNLNLDNYTEFYKHQIHNNVRRNDPLLPEIYKSMMTRMTRFPGWFHGIYLQNMKETNVVINYSRNGNELVYSKSNKRVYRKDSHTGYISNVMTEFHMHEDIKLLYHPIIPNAPVVGKVYAKSYNSAHDYQYLYIRDFNDETIHDCEWIID